jgi:hypothetical protein
MIMPRDFGFGQAGGSRVAANDGHLRVFNHHVYEYRKGLRPLALQTLPGVHEAWVRSRLERLGIDHLVYSVGTRRINVFLGDAVCLDVIRRIGKTDLSDYTPEEDFMLGIMLGYDSRQQCARYLALVRQDRGGRPGASDEQEEELWGTAAGLCRGQGSGTEMETQNRFGLVCDESMVESEVSSC